MPELATQELVLNMGPQHPSTHGVLRLVLRVDGEIVQSATPHIGFMHRCAEKVGEGVTYEMFTPYTDRTDYLAGMNYNLAYAIAVERLMGVAVPERAEYLRVIIVELNRIASHLVSFGTYGADMGAVTPFLWAFREREMIIDLFEEVCGQRLTYNYIRIGGLAADVPEGWLDKAKRFLDYFEPRIKEYHTLLTFNPIFIKRTANIGVLPRDLALNYGVSGPMLRASGVSWDLRRDEPYGVYPRFRFDVPVGVGRMGTTGDCWDRYYVRMREMEESCKIIRQALAALPATGEVRAKLPRGGFKVPAGELFVRTEGARGEIGFYIIADGGPKAYRMKIRGPSFCNLSVISEISRGAYVADLVAILGSIDIVLCDVDR